MAGERAEIDGQAALWVERLNNPVLDSALAREFDSWIAQDPRCIESYARMTSLWHSRGFAHALHAGTPRNDNDRSERAAGSDRSVERPDAIASRLTALRAAPRKLAGIAAGIAAMLVAIPLGQGLLAPDVGYATTKGQDRIVALADGSQIHMSGSTELSIRITPWSRSVRMERGEAFFDIAHEKVRSFTVDTGTASVAVLGTAFDIDMAEAGGREVRVYRGEVGVTSGNGEWRLPAGTGIVISDGKMQTLGPVTGDWPAWIDGWFDAQDTELSRLVERLNRTSDQPIVLADPALGELRVTGRFELGRPREILSTLTMIHELDWQERNGRHILSRR